MEPSPVSDLILPGVPSGELHAQRPAVPGEEVSFVQTEPVMGADGRLYELRIEGTADVVRGPLGQFLDLRDRLVAEGHVVHPEISEVLDRLNTT